jgi:DNA polymerase elongation subunit (family B)
MTIDVNNHFAKFNTNYKIKWHYCETEYELMTILFNDLIPKMPIITGWNFIKYDWVYFVTRARKLGINPEVASPSGKLEKPWSKNDSTNINQFMKNYQDIDLYLTTWIYLINGINQ